MSDTQTRLQTALTGRYEIQRQIGEGGMATVLLARDVKHGRDVAIKVLRAELAATIGPERFLREIEIAARLQHPHILPVYDSGEADGILYYVMPFVEGESLQDVMSRGPISPDHALRIARQVASALEYAHRQGVVHRDIKPANILLSQGLAVVADFGIARVAQSDRISLTQVGMAVGTPWYMSPEQATADPNVDGRSDIYALGSVLFEMLEQRPPFAGKTAQTVIAQTLSAPIPTLSRSVGRVPATVVAAVQRALAKDPDERFQTAGEFERALETTTGELPAAKPRSYATVGVLGIAALVVMLFVGLRALRPNTVVATGADVIAVLPFDVAGASAELGEGMVSLLSTNLNAVGELHTIDARTVLQRWRARGGESGLDLAGSLQVGRDVGAGSILLGSVVEAGSGIRLTAEMYHVDGTELARVQIDGDASNALRLVDSLSLSILRAIWRSNEPVPSFDVAAISSGSLEAVRAYMRGTLAFRRGEWNAAATAFEEAVSIDSTFALAHLARSDAYGWTRTHGSEDQLEAIEAAARFSDRLPPRDQLLVSGYELNHLGSSAAIDTMLAYTKRYPTDPRGWYALGDFQFHLKDLIRSPEEVLAPFDRALALDSSYAAALVHSMEIAILQGDDARFNRYLSLNRATGASDRRLPQVAAAVWGDRNARLSALDSLVATRNVDGQFLVASSTLAHRVGQLPDVIATIQKTADGHTTRAISTQYNIGLLTLATGKLEQFHSTVDVMQASDSSYSRSLGTLLRILAFLGGIEDSAYAEPAVERYQREVGDPPTDQTIRALTLVASGNAAAARAALPTTPPEGNGVHFTRGVLGWIELLEGDTAQATIDLQSAIDSLGTVWIGTDQLRNVLKLQLARVLAAQPETHERGIRMLRYGFPIFHSADVYPARLIALAEALEAAGDYPGAIEAYAKFVELWNEADARLQPRVENARQRIAALNRLTQ